MLDQQSAKSEQAHRVAMALHEGRIAPEESWVRMRWMEPHILEVLQLELRGELCITQVSRADSIRNDRRLHAYAVKVLDRQEFPNRFMAEAARYEVLEAVSQWRVRVTKSFLAAGGSTEAWVPGAPVPPLRRVKRSLAARGVARHSGDGVLV